MLKVRGIRSTPALEGIYAVDYNKRRRVDWEWMTHPRCPHCLSGDTRRTGPDERVCGNCSRTFKIRLDDDSWHVEK